MEVGVLALIFEGEQKPDTSRQVWDGAIARSIRLMLGRAFYADGDYERSALTMRDFLDQPEITGDEKGLGHYLLGESYRRAGDKELARRAYEAGEESGDPSFWRKASAEALASLDSNIVFPDEG